MMDRQIGIYRPVANMDTTYGGETGTAWTLVLNCYAHVIYKGGGDAFEAEQPIGQRKAEFITFS